MENIVENDISKDKAPAETLVPLSENSVGQDTPAGPGLALPADKPKKRRRGWIVAVVIILVLALVLALPRLLGRPMVSTDGVVTPYTVERSDITVTLSGSGTLQPADSYTVTSLISGDIVSAQFEEGDVAGKDQVLYAVDSSDVDNSIQQAETNVSDSQYKYDLALRQLESLKLKASGMGTVTKLDIQVGDMITAGQTIAVIQDSNAMSLKVLYQREAAESISIGESAVVTLESTNETYTGIVTDIATVDQVLTGNVIAREVTVQVTNPGAFSPSQSAFVSIGGLAGLQSSTFTYGYQGSVIATVSGKVAQIIVKVGSHVTKGQVLAVLQSDSLDQQVQNAKSALENAQLSLDSQNNKLTSYFIKSPISGTIVEKNVKEGDTLKSGAVLCTIFDLSYLTLTLKVDELDIKKVQPGQTVTITADAAEGKTYSGTVTKVIIKGTTLNGVTSYPVTIRIDKTDGLLPGMNVDAKIVINTMNNVLTVPVGAVMRNNFVLLKTGDPNAQKPTEPGVPAGFSYTEVTLGASNDKDIVVTSGLKEGDIVAIMDNTPSSYDYNVFGPRPRNQQASSEGSVEGGAEKAQAERASAGVAG